MNPRLICVGLLLMLPGCNRPAAQVNRAIESSSQVETREAIDFDDLLEKIKNCNHQDLAYFNRYWDEIHKQLKHAAEDGLLADLPLGQQRELWDELSYLQGCRDGDIMREHGDDIVKILFTFGTPNQQAFLREIFPDGE